MNAAATKAVWLANVDWNLLHEQRLTLVEATRFIGLYSEGNAPIQAMKSALEGIQNLLDHLQDEAATAGLFVFPVCCDECGEKMDKCPSCGTYSCYRCMSDSCPGCGLDKDITTKKFVKEVDFDFQFTTTVAVRARKGTAPDTLQEAACLKASQAIATGSCTIEHIGVEELDNI